VIHGQQSCLVVCGKGTKPPLQCERPGPVSPADRFNAPAKLAKCQDTQKQLVVGHAGEPGPDVRVGPLTLAQF
jgi:hypothetical protein